mgnify:CR=1 FL=1|jgi:methanogen homoaconitase small subunit
MMDRIEGKVWTFPDSIDTDVIIPGRYLRAQTMDELAAHVMEPIDPSFAGKIKHGDIIVAGWNFGCGSSREQAPVALKHAGIAAVVAKSFARIFYRNAINIGLPVIVADMDVSNGDEICIDLENGNITDKSTGKTFKVQPFKKFMLEILEDGGLTHHYLKKQE